MEINMTKALSFLLPLFFLVSCQKEAVSDVTVPQERDVYAVLKELGVELGSVKAPIANYANAIKTGNLIFLAGKGSRDENGELITGKLGQDLSVDEGYRAARSIAISQLEVLHNELGDLNRVTRLVKVTGMVNATDDFTQHPEVINGFSDFMVEVFGDRGKHARAAVGMSSLPRNLAVEIDLIVEFL